MNLDPSLQKRYDKTLANSELFLDGDQNSQNLLAKGVGISSATASAYLKGSYRGSVENVVKKFEDFFALREKRVDLIIEPAFVKTAQSQRIWYMLSRAHVLRKISVIISASGVGKTKTSLEYTRKNSGVYYIECDPFMTGKKEFTKALCRALGIAGELGTRDRFLKARTLAAQQGALVIFDHMEFISQDTRASDTVYQIIRSLNDHGVGCVLVGNYRIRDKVLTNSLEDFNQQFASRSEIRVIPDEFSEADIRAVVAAVVKHRLDGDIMDYLYQVANRYIGGLRIMVSALNSAALQASSLGESMSVAFLEEALNAISSEIKPAYKNKKGKKIGISKKTSGNPEAGNEREDPASAVA